MRAAGAPPISTVKEPSTMLSGGPTQTHIEPTLACGMLQVSTVGAPGPTMGPPTCGTSTVSIGQTCMSVRRAAGCPISTVLVADMSRPTTGDIAGTVKETCESRGMALG